ncbi:polysaccharide biosynthesis/export family protein [Algoriphagus halophytocola]|uniref:Polysaccharide biosynthesis/export family protein n=1 Tax=Algoriphagus halophytocola TaxID=2991499 RepID=A0ABY6MHT6_9BACT|nr:MULTISPECIES: polysaccharide biosynthesis/export family protein [unclassified Algoriphagus]UZD23044.1 polysaccharide biosynthesis/export family protein [Algoriphagus sp. TR-M5]WBL44336.1 polysaccharide biosynthesis/export family protein [Algoriphagus sp. TR-M9]
MNITTSSNKRNFVSKLFFLLLSISLISSCIPNRKVLYLQNEDNDPSLQSGNRIPYHMVEYELQYNDIVDVQVVTNDEIIQNGFSITRMETNQNFGMQQGQGGGDVYYMTGYSVDEEGMIELPLLGKVKVGNLTLDQAKEQIREQLSNYIKSDFYVRVKLGGIRYSALGEFKNPGKYVVLQDRMTIFEAIANAGDLTTIAKRDKLLLIRQYPDGSEVFEVDLNDRSLLNSDFYFIRPNDQLYAEPLKVRELGAGENAAQSLTLLISLFTFAALMLNLTK